MSFLTGLRVGIYFLFGKLFFQVINLKLCIPTYLHQPDFTISFARSSPLCEIRFIFGIPRLFMNKK